jgi:non-canonical (house-cleaning) NTP pyrophosphatase
VVVASLDAAKLAAVRAAVGAWFGGAVEATGVEATGVEATGDRDAGLLLAAGMHIGMQHTFEGCAARMQQLLLAGGSGGSTDGSAPARPDFLVAVECGVIPIVSRTTTSGHEVACVMVMDVTSQRTRHAFSQTRPYPLTIVQEMARQGMSAAEVAEFCAAHYEKAELTCSHADQIRVCTQLVLSDLLPPQPGMTAGE